MNKPRLDKTNKNVSEKSSKLRGNHFDKTEKGEGEQKLDFQKPKSSSKIPEISVSVYWSPVWGKEVIKKMALSVSSKNEVGNFDILPFHANFITIIFDTIKIRTREEEIIYNFRRGVLEVSDNAVSVFLGL